MFNLCSAAAGVSHSSHSLTLILTSHSAKSLTVSLCSETSHPLTFAYLSNWQIGLKARALCYFACIPLTLSLCETSPALSLLPRTFAGCTFAPRRLAELCKLEVVLECVQFHQCSTVHRCIFHHFPQGIKWQ